jgi:transcriptional regulator with XRE-family HTH domain
MPAGNGRRAPGLRREEVAVLAGVGVSWYTWLEQGREINVSAEVLDAVARVLRLDAAEREHLHLLARLNPPRPQAVDRAVPEGVRRVLDGWSPRPAYVLDRHWNRVAVNREARLAFRHGDGDHNCLVGHFQNTWPRSATRHWQHAARVLVGQFRADAARYPDDPEYGRIAEELCTVSPAFAELWAEHPVGGALRGTKVLHHPEAGELAFEYTTLAPSDLPGYRMLLYLPAGETGERPAASAEGGGDGPRFDGLL